MDDKEIKIPFTYFLQFINNGWQENGFIEMFHDLKDFSTIVTNEAFNEYYQVISSTKYHLIVKKTPRSCRFCGLNEPETSFNQDTHLISAFLGAKTFYFEECDTCNGIFSKYESHFSKYYGPYLTLLGIEGRKGVPIFSSRSNDESQQYRTIITNENGERKIHMELINDFPLNEASQTGTFNIRTPPLKMINIYKLIVKFGMSIMPYNKIEECKGIFTWLVGNDVTCIPMPMLFENRLNKMFATPQVHLFERKQIFNQENIYTPKYSLIICFANIVGQIFLPAVGEEAVLLKKRFEIGKKPTIISDLIFSNINNVKQLDLTSDMNLGRDYSIEISYEKSVEE